MARVEVTGAVTRAKSKRVVALFQRCFLQRRMSTSYGATIYHIDSKSTLRCRERWLVKPLPCGAFSVIELYIDTKGDKALLAYQSDRLSLPITNDEVLVGRSFASGEVQLATYLTRLFVAPTNHRIAMLLHITLHRTYVGVSQSYNWYKHKTNVPVEMVHPTLDHSDSWTTQVGQTFRA